MVQPAAGYKGNAVVNTKISLPPAAGGAVVAVSLDSCEIDIVWKIHQSIWENIEIRPKTNDMTDGKTSLSADLEHFSTGN